MFAEANYDVRRMVLRADDFEDFTVRLASRTRWVLLFLGQLQFGQDDEPEQ